MTEDITTMNIILNVLTHAQFTFNELKGVAFDGNSDVDIVNEVAARLSQKVEAISYVAK